MYPVDSRPFNVAELSPFDHDLGVSFLGCIPDLTSNVFPFTVTIRPDEQSPAVPRLLLNVLGNVSLVLKTVSDWPHEYTGIVDTYARDKSGDGSTK